VRLKLSPSPRLLPALAACLAAAPALAADPPPAHEQAWDLVRQTAPGQGLLTGETAEIRLLVVAGRGLKVVLTQTGTDTTAAAAGEAASGNELALEVAGPEATFRGAIAPVPGTERAGGPAAKQVEIAPEDLVAGTWTVRVRGEWVPRGPEGYRLSVAGDVKEVLEPAGGLIPAELAQSDPNPVRDNTTIRFTLQEPGDILLGVFDIAGRPVRTLAEGSRGAGAHAVAWNGRDAAGDRVPAGIYFYRLEGAGFDVTRKLVVVR
jgi:hypothetical protein